MNLSGKVALVTGAARRVGRAIALELGQAGARLVVHHHASPDEASEVVQRIGTAGAVAVQADLRDAAGVQALFAAARNFGGGVDILVNSAADFERVSFAELDDARWEAMLQLNLLAPVRCARAAAADMTRRGGGVIINILDVAAFTPWRGYAHYCASKAALAMLTKSLALELAPAIRTVGVAPGTILFPEKFTKAQRDAVRARIPVGHEGAPEDIARAVRFLAEQDFINGAILAVDGGRLVESGEAY